MFPVRMESGFNRRSLGFPVKTSMGGFKDPDTGRGAEDIGEPIEGIIAAASGDEALVKFIHHPDQAEDEDHSESDDLPAGFAGSPSEEVSSEKT